MPTSSRIRSRSYKESFASGWNHIAASYRWDQPVSWLPLKRFPNGNKFTNIVIWGPCLNSTRSHIPIQLVQFWSDRNETGRVNSPRTRFSTAISTIQYVYDLCFLSIQRWRNLVTIVYNVNASRPVTNSEKIHWQFFDWMSQIPGIFWYYKRGNWASKRSSVVWGIRFSQTFECLNVLQQSYQPRWRNSHSFWRLG